MSKKEGEKKGNWHPRKAKSPKSDQISPLGSSKLCLIYKAKLVRFSPVDTFTNLFRSFAQQFCHKLYDNKHITNYQTTVLLLAKCKPSCQILNI